MRTLDLRPSSLIVLEFIFFFMKFDPTVSNNLMSIKFELGANLLAGAYLRLWMGQVAEQSCLPAHKIL